MMGKKTFKDARHRWRPTSKCLETGDNSPPAHETNRTSAWSSADGSMVDRILFWNYVHDHHLIDHADAFSERSTPSAIFKESFPP